MDIKRTVHGVGYVGTGRYITSVKGMRTHTYMTWYNMMTRCYSKKLHERCPQYKECEVSADWHNFQSFAEWYENHEFAGLGYQLDKDLIKSGNNTYGSKYCCLIPQELNKLIITRKTKTKFLVGVKKHKKSNKYSSSINIDRRPVHLGSFDTEIEAHLAYVKSKESEVRSKAREWRGLIEDKAYQALINWDFRLMY